MPDELEPLTKKFSLWEMVVGMSISLAGAALMVGLSYGGYTEAQENTNRKVEKNEESINEMKEDIQDLKVVSEVTKIRVEAIDKRSERIEEAVNTLLTRIPNGTQP